MTTNMFRGTVTTVVFLSQHHQIAFNEGDSLNMLVSMDENILETSNDNQMIMAAARMFVHGPAIYYYFNFFFGYCWAVYFRVRFAKVIKWVWCMDMKGFSGIACSFLQIIFAFCVLCFVLSFLHFFLLICEISLPYISQIKRDWIIIYLSLIFLSKFNPPPIDLGKVFFFNM